MTPLYMTDFREFLKLVWNHLGLPEPTPVQLDIAYELQHGPRRLVIEAFRGVGKSWITSAFVCWLLLIHPQHNILVVSASKVRADDFSTFTLRLIRELPELHHLIPRDGQRDTKVAFDVGPAKASHAPSVKSLGITSQLTGSRADIVIADDTEVPSNSQTQLMREKLSEAVKEFDSVIKPGGRIVFLGTPQCEQSLYNQLPGRGYTIMVWPSRYPTPKEREMYGSTLSPRIASALDKQPALAGKPIDPRRFNDLDLREREASYGKAGFQLQFQLNTRLSDLDRYPLKVRDLSILTLDAEKGPEKVVWGIDPEKVCNDLPNMAMNGDRFYRPMALVGEWVNYTGSVLAIDPSGRGNNETGFAVVKMLNHQLFVVAAGGFVGGYDTQTLQALSVLAAKHRVNRIIIEANFGDGMFTSLIQPILGKIYPCTVEEVKHSKQKELRICDTLEPLLSTHKLIVDPGVILSDYEALSSRPAEHAHKYSLVYQMTRITRERGALAIDDRIDALAMACAYWVEQMRGDTDKAMVSRKDDLRKMELDKFMDHVLGRSQFQSGVGGHRFFRV